MRKHLKWWKKLPEIEKWNMTINYIVHWVDLTDQRILELYKKEVE